MSKKILTVIFLITNQTVFSQITFQKKYQIAELDQECSICSLSDGSAIFSSYVQIVHPGQGDFSLTRIDSLGNLLWTKIYGSSNTEESAYFPIQISDGNIIITGGTPFGVNGGVFFAKLDLNGDIIWAKSIGGNGGEITFNPAIETHDNGFAIGAFTNSIGAGNYDFYLLRTDSSGNLLWAKSYGGSGYDDNPIIIETNDYGFIMAGRVVMGFGAQGEDILLVRTDSLGNLLWAKKYGAGNNDFPYSLNKTPDNGYFISGRTYSFGTSYENFFLKIDSIGNIQWFKVFENFRGSYTNILPNFEIIAGGAADNVAQIISPCILKTDSLGNIIWNRLYTPHCAGANVLSTVDGGFIQIGICGNYDTLLVIKTNGNGHSTCDEDSINFNVISPTINDTSVTLSVDSGGTSISINLQYYDTIRSVFNCTPLTIGPISNSQFSILISPNPFHSSTVLKLSDDFSKSSSHLLIYSLQGTLIKDVLIRGKETTINRNGIESGLYLYKLISEKEIIGSGKLVIY